MLLHQNLLESIVQTLSAGKRAALCAVVKTRGSTPQSPGAMLLLDEQMKTVGTLGGGCVEAEVCKRAFGLLERDEASLLSFQLDHDYGWDDGLICGGGMDVAVMPLTSVARADEFRKVLADVAAGVDTRVHFRVLSGSEWCEYAVLVEAEPKLVIAGAGHVGAQLARLCVELEFDVTVIDDREDFANADRLPAPIKPVVGDIEQTLRTHPIDRDTYVVIVTRGHNHDEQALSAVINSDAKYLGMIGSKRKIKLIFDDLQAAGVDASRLERVHAPIGLDINSVTVPEIAVSIAAQLVAVRRENQGRLVEGPTPVEAEKGA
ncbi:MAG: XdhC family protein [Phycisphaerales bacterium]|nr:XdhC family protein [Phycisphaerales bacterium]